MFLSGFEGASIKAILILGFIVFTLALGAGVVYTYNSSVKRAIVAEKALQEVTEAYTELQARTTLLDTLLEQRTKEEQDAREEAAEFKKAFELLREANEHVRFWAGGKLPINPATGKLRQ